MFGLVASYVYYSVFHRLVKWMLHIVTGRCELLRITMSQSSLSSKTFRIESSLRRSKLERLNQVLAPNVDIDETVNYVVAMKRIDIDRFPGFPASFRINLSQIVGYRQLVLDIDNVRKVPFSSTNPEHEQLLSQLWSTLRPDVPLPSRTGHHWTEIGFQGDDPATDFRGMGLLGLQNLVYLCTRHTSIARKLLSRSNHPQFGYSFAIVGINLTQVGFQLLRECHLRSHFYNAVIGAPQIDDFHNVYVYLFYNFDAFWFAEEPVDIMQFNIVKEKFQKIVTEQLMSSTALLQLNV